MQQDVLYEDNCSNCGDLFPIASLYRLHCNRHVVCGGCSNQLITFDESLNLDRPQQMICPFCDWYRLAGDYWDEDIQRAREARRQQMIDEHSTLVRSLVVLPLNHVEHPDLSTVPPRVQYVYSETTMHPPKKKCTQTRSPSETESEESDLDTNDESLSENQVAEENTILLSESKTAVGPDTPAQAAIEDDDHAVSEPNANGNDTSESETVPIKVKGNNPNTDTTNESQSLINCEPNATNTPEKETVGLPNGVEDDTINNNAISESQSPTNSEQNTVNRNASENETVSNGVEGDTPNAETTSELQSPENETVSNGVEDETQNTDVTSESQPTDSSERVESPASDWNYLLFPSKTPYTIKDHAAGVQYIFYPFGQTNTQQKGEYKRSQSSFSLREHTTLVTKKEQTITQRSKKTQRKNYTTSKRAFGIPGPAMWDIEIMKDHGDDGEEVLADELIPNHHAGAQGPDEVIPNHHVWPQVPIEELQPALNGADGANAANNNIFENGEADDEQEIAHQAEILALIDNTEQGTSATTTPEPTQETDDPLDTPNTLSPDGSCDDEDDVTLSCDIEGPGFCSDDDDDDYHDEFYDEMTPCSQWH